MSRRPPRSTRTDTLFPDTTPFRSGPLELADFIGLDTCLSIMSVLYDGLADSKYRPCPLLVKYVEAGWIGKKVGRGFYDYSSETPVPTRQGGRHGGLGTSPPHEFERPAGVLLVFHLQELAGRAVPVVQVDLTGEFVGRRPDRLHLGLYCPGSHRGAS